MAASVSARCSAGACTRSCRRRPPRRRPSHPAAASAPRPPPAASAAAAPRPRRPPWPSAGPPWWPRRRGAPCPRAPAACRGASSGTWRTPRRAPAPRRPTARRGGRPPAPRARPPGRRRQRNLPHPAVVRQYHPRPLPSWHLRHRARQVVAHVKKPATARPRAHKQASQENEDVVVELREEEEVVVLVGWIRVKPRSI